MTSIIGIIIAAVLGVVGILFGSSERNRRKAAEEKNEKLTAELQHKVEQSILADKENAEHINNIGQIISKPDEELVNDANALFAAADTLGSKLEKIRVQKGFSQLSASKTSGLTIRRINDIENNQDITESDITKLGKAYGLEKAEIKELKALIIKAEEATGKEVEKKI